jgi:hypothetical protein
MRKEDAISTLTWIEESLRELRTEVQRIKTTNIYRKPVYDEAQEVCRKWFEELEPSLVRFGISDEVRTKYQKLFTALVQLSVKTSVRATYLKGLDQIILGLKDEILVPVMVSSGRIVSLPHLSEILESATRDEKEYLEEALGCAGQGFLRASVVLGWSAAVHRMHKAIEKFGFNEFSKKTEEMKNISEGRFKRFKKSFSVQSLSEFEVTVFDNDMLWVLEYMGWIDANQHERLQICFTMRKNSAHPGEAPITDDNLASFYSDLKTMIFENPKFKL